MAVPLETAYNQFTQFEDWPEFMHRVTRVTHVVRRRTQMSADVSVVVCTLDRPRSVHARRTLFFELIQRENHRSFGEGNFGALFRSIERDQEKRGVL